MAACPTWVFLSGWSCWVGLSEIGMLLLSSCFWCFLFNSSIRGVFFFSLQLGLGWSELQILGVCRAALILILPFSTGPATNCPSQSAIINTSLLNRPIQILFLSTGQDINCLVNQQPLQILGLGWILVLPFSTAPRYLYCPSQPPQILVLPFSTAPATYIVLANRPRYRLGWVGQSQISIALFNLP